MKAQLFCVDPSAKIGNNVEIGNFTTIHEDVEIGDNTIIGSNVTIFPGARIGKNVTIFPGAVVSGMPQDLKYRGEKTYAYVGDGTVIRECVTIHRGTASKGKTVVGKNCLIMAYSHVAHDCCLGNNIIISNAVQLAGEVVVDDYAIIGGGSLVHQFSRLGKHIMVQGGSLVNKDIPPYIKAARDPISYVGLNTIGLHRRGFTQEQINIIQEVYRLLYMSDLNVTNALNLIMETMPQSEIRDEIVEFVRSSERGVVRSSI